MSPHRPIILLLVGVAVAALSVSPVLAEKNTGAFQKSIEAFKLGMGQVCADFGAQADALDKKARHEADLNKAEAEHKAAGIVRDMGWALGCRM